MKKTLVLLFFVLILCACSRFDQEIWKNEPDRRESMVNSLTYHYTLIGMTESDIIKLLGKPNQTISTSPKQLLYFVGYGGLFGIKVNVLQLIFDEYGSVQSHHIVSK